ncbi:hypothetical protein CHR29_16585 [Pseudomonas monteilii]|uniref:hypothetical protein n=1 Tax=Pseudomonas TaxID=286 RepID=UPI000EF64319|nr:MULTISPECIES: hypothetical protein [Pseudomonas]AYN15527.1 hypothetical protein CHR29_10380 [Pseudomonas monteilii]AYN16675.1 hypothetical protein CHR29_16585 [Pseudomonas monteilii]AYO00814.1 hypothetical protein D8767_18400 [Pseudomonas sp. LTGT-11-2Z]MBA6090337.1 hypothetical protein [Pseudomonas monteilii]MBA6105653.1 hypothetical protein [Pseudomonas monteilii]
MPYIAINLSNAYDPENNTRFATPEEADARARAVLNQFPTAQVFTAQVLKEYSAKVSITAKEPAEPESVPAPEEPAA